MFILLHIQHGKIILCVFEFLLIQTYAIADVYRQQQVSAWEADNQSMQKIRKRNNKGQLNLHVYCKRIMMNVHMQYIHTMKDQGLWIIIKRILEGSTNIQAKNQL